MTQVLATVSAGLAASLTWGGSDFCGGLASRRSPVANVIIGAYTAGIVFLVALALLWREPFPGLSDIMWGGLAGLIGVVGFTAFYSALAVGLMGVIAPVSGILAVVFPVLFSTLTEGLPSPLKISGFILALLAIVLISRPERTKGIPKGLGLAVLAGCCFGCVFILVSRTSHTETFGPLVVMRLISVLILLILSVFRKQPVMPQDKTAVRLILLTGILDALGNVLFVVAAHSGRLDIASVLSTLYPAITAILAAIVLRERVTRLQVCGILLALVAIPLISV